MGVLVGIVDDGVVEEGGGVGFGDFGMVECGGVDVEVLVVFGVVVEVWVFVGGVECEFFWIY